jgi:hypothetical protein
MKRFILAAIIALSPATQSFADVENTKKEILDLAKSYEGLGDPDSSKQKNLDVLVNRLLIENPQPPVQDRLNQLYGAWKQVWGPYEYRKNDRSVDPEIDPKNIVQVIFEGGYYYNVNPKLNKQKIPESTTLLRGEFVLDPSRENVLNIKFTDLREIAGLPQNGLRLQDLAELSESRNLEGERNALPGFLVRLFFGGGALREVYTDRDLRITYGSSRNNILKNNVYILSRMPD